MKFQTCKYEKVFYKVILSNRDILKKYVENLINEKVTYVNILNSKLIVNNIELRSKTVDILLETDESIVNIEINTKFTKLEKERNLKYLFTILSNVEKVRESYITSKKVIQVNLNFPNKKNNGNVYKIIGQDNTIYSEKVKIINYNIEYYKELCYNQVNKDELTYLLGILDMDNKELDKIVKERRELKMLADMIKDINDEKKLFEYMDPLEEKKKWERTYELIGEKRGEKKGRKSGIIEGRKAGIIEGEKRGKKSGILETAKKMLNKKIDINLISEITGLSTKQIMML